MSDSDQKCPVDHNSREIWLKQSCPMPNKGCNSEELDQVNPHKSQAHSSIPSALSSDREISSIPRNDRKSNWVYPSEKMFFDAMKRKNFDPNAHDMQTIIPIHNAVNERAWMEILKWEDGENSEACGGPKLASFSGDSSRLTPRARFNVLLGYERPFDRHDWVIDRCGKQIEYVIDFYTGKSNNLTPGMPSFYLDTRPKLNSFEGVKMRIRRYLFGK